MQNRNNAKASPESKPVARVLKPTPTRNSDLFHCGVLALISLVTMDATAGETPGWHSPEPFLPCHFLEGLGARRLPTKLLSCMRIPTNIY